MEPERFKLRLGEFQDPGETTKGAGFCGDTPHGLTGAGRAPERPRIVIVEAHAAIVKFSGMFVLNEIVNVFNAQGYADVWEIDAEVKTNGATYIGPLH